MQKIIIIIIAILLIIFVITKNGNHSGNLFPEVEGFADRTHQPVGAMGFGGGTYISDIVNDLRESNPYLIWGGKGGNSEYTGGCAGGGCVSLRENTLGTIADNQSKINYAEFGAEPNAMNNAVGKGMAYLSPTNYMPSGTNMYFAGEPYMPDYSEYEPPLF